MTVFSHQRRPGGTGPLSFRVAWTPERTGRLTLRVTRCLCLWVRKFLNHRLFTPQALEMQTRFPKGQPAEEEEESRD